jgi:hypothetical protein
LVMERQVGSVPCEFHSQLYRWDQLKACHSTRLLSEYWPTWCLKPHLWDTQGSHEEIVPEGLQVMSLTWPFLACSFSTKIMDEN